MALVVLIVTVNSYNNGAYAGDDGTDESHCGDDVMVVMVIVVMMVILVVIVV